MNLEYDGLLASLRRAIAEKRGLAVSTESVQWCWEGLHNAGTTRVSKPVGGRSEVIVRREINIDKRQYAFVTAEEYEEMKKLIIAEL